MCSWRYCIAIICLLFVCVHSKSNYKFEWNPSADDLIHQKSYNEIRSPVECAWLCAENRIDDGLHKLCEGHSYNVTDKSCQLFSAQKGGDAAIKLHVYKYQVVKGEYPNNVFEHIVEGGQTYLYYLSDHSYTFLKAQEDCWSNDGYLLNINNMDEYHALEAFSKFKSYTGRSYAGAQDIATESVWINDRYKTPLDFDVWKFLPGEPNNMAGEDCAVFHFGSLRLSDISCHSKLRVVCERTP